jgi:hypothetical protein
MAEEKELDRYEAEMIAERAARRALVDAFRFFGVNIDDFESMESFRANLLFLDGQRKGSEALKVRMREGIWYLLGVAALGAIYLAWDVIKAGITSLWGH